MLGFWMGKDSKDHPLGERGSTEGPGFAESGGRNWVHSAATVLAFLQAERGLLKPGYRFQPMIRDEVLRKFDAKTPNPPLRAITPAPASGVIIEPPDSDERKSNVPQGSVSG